MKCLLLLAFFSLLLIHCKKIQSGNDEFAPPQSDGKESALHGDSGDRSLVLTHYTYADDGSIVRGEGTKTYTLGFPATSPKVDQPQASPETTRIALLHKVQLAFLKPDLSVVDTASEKMLGQGCYFAAYNKEGHYFYLNQFQRIESFIVNLTEPTLVSFSGLLCIDEDGQLVSIAANNAFIDSGLGLDAMRNVISALNITLKEHTALALTGLKSSGWFDRLFKTDSPGKKIETEVVKTETGRSEITPSTRVRDFPRPEKIDTKGPARSNLFSFLRGKLIGTKKIPEVKVEPNVKLAKDILSLDGPLIGGSTYPLADGAQLKVGELLGEGSFGKVFHAEVIEPNGAQRSFALKAFKRDPPKTSQHPELKDSPYFLQDYGISKNRNFQVVELGRQDLTLEMEAFKTTKGAFRRRGDLFHEIFAATAVLQKNNLVHWDLKPGNMIRGTDNRVKIIDLDDVSKAASEFKGGTPFFVSPERIRQMIGEKGIMAGPPGDVYALGVMLMQSKYAGSRPNLRRDAVFLDDLYKSCCQIKTDEKLSSESYFLSGQKQGELAPAHITELERTWAEFNQYIKNDKKLMSEDQEELTLIAKMVHPDPTKRPTIEEVIEEWSVTHEPPQPARDEAQLVFAGN